jgi:hypothetical protein
VNAYDRNTVESIVRDVHALCPCAENKIYPIADLQLLKQVFDPEFSPVYSALPNFHFIEGSSTEAFTTGKMGESGIDYDHVRATLQVMSRRVLGSPSASPHSTSSSGDSSSTDGYSSSMTAIGEKLFELTWNSKEKTDLKINRNDGDSSVGIDWGELPGWQDKMIEHIPSYELHHAVDIPNNSPQLPFHHQKPLELIDINAGFNETAHADMFNVGGLFVLYQEGVWAYRTCEFSNSSYQEAQERLMQQSLLLRRIVADLLPIGTHFSLSASVEKVHAIWRFQNMVF